MSRHRHAANMSCCHSLGFDKLPPTKQLSRWEQGGYGSETWQDHGRDAVVVKTLSGLLYKMLRGAPQQLQGWDGDVLLLLHFEGGSKTLREARLSVLQQNLQSCHLPGPWLTAAGPLAS